MLPASTSVAFNVLGENLNAENDSYLYVIPASGIINVSSSPPKYFSLIQEKCDEFSIDRPSNAENVFRLALRSVNIIGEQCKLLL